MTSERWWLFWSIADAFFLFCAVYGAMLCSWQPAIFCLAFAIYANAQAWRHENEWEQKRRHRRADPS